MKYTVYLITDSAGTVRYIGKGVTSRVLAAKQYQNHNVCVRSMPTPRDVLEVFHTDSNTEALKEEARLIKLYNSTVYNVGCPSFWANNKMLVSIGANPLTVLTPNELATILDIYSITPIKGLLTEAPQTFSITTKLGDLLPVETFEYPTEQEHKPIQKHPLDFYKELTHKVFNLGDTLSIADVSAKVSQHYPQYWNEDLGVSSNALLKLLNLFYVTKYSRTKKTHKILAKKS